MGVFKRACFDGFHAAADSWIFCPRGGRRRTSEVGTDLRAVRVCDGRSLRRSVSAGLALSVKSLYLGGAWVRLGLSNNPESLESCRFEIRGFGGSSARFFLIPDEAESVRGPPDLIRIPSGNRQAEAGSIIR